MQYPTLSTQDAFVRASGLEASTNTLPGSWEIHGPFSAREIIQAIQKVVDGHESLRTAIVHQRRTFLQRVSAGGGVSHHIRRLDLTRTETGPALQKQIGKLLAHQFDLTSPPLWRGVLARVGRGRSVLCLAFAHVIADEVSLAVFGRDLARALATQKGPNPPQLGMLAVRERRLRPSNAQATWWSTQYGKRTALPDSWQGIAHYHVASVRRLDPHRVAALGSLSQRLGVEAATMFAGAVSVVAAAALGRPAPMLGFAVPARNADNHGAFGPLSDHLPVLGGAPAKTEFAGFVRGLQLRRSMAQEYRLPCGVLERIAGTTPYDIAVNFAAHAQPSTYRVGDNAFVIPRPVPVMGRVALSQPTSVAPTLAVILRPNRDGSIAGDVIASSGVFAERQASSLAAAFGAVLENALGEPGTPIGQLLRRDA